MHLPILIVGCELVKFLSLSNWYYFEIEWLKEPHWTTHFLKLSLIKEGTTEKVSQFLMPLKSILDKGLCFNYQKCIFELYKKVKHS